MCSRSVNALEPAVDKDGHAQCTGNTSREPGTVRRTARKPQFSLTIISVTVQIQIKVFFVISVYFNLRNILPKSGTFPRDTLYIYRVSQEERTKLREGVPYVKLYRYNPKHLYPKLNGYGDNGQRKVWSSCISA